MAIPRQLTQIAFAAGLDESTEDEVLDPSVGFPVLQNVRQDHRGGISKRLGFTQLASYSGSTRCLSHNGVPCLITSGSALIYSAALSNLVSVNGMLNGSAGECTVERIPLSASVASEVPVTLDAVVCNGFLVVTHGVWSFFLGVQDRARASVYTATSPAPLLLTKDLLSFASDAVFRMAAVGNTVYVAIGNTSNGNIELWYLDCTSIATVAAGWTNVGTILTDRSTSSRAFSMCALSDPYVAIVYGNDHGGTSRLSFAIANTVGAVSSTINTSSTTPDQVGIDASQGSTLWVCWDEGLNVRLKPFSIAGAVLGSPVTIEATAGLTTSSPPIVLSTGANSAIVYTVTGLGSTFRLEVHHTAGAITLDSSVESYGFHLASQPFLHNSRPFSLVTASDNNTVNGANSYSVALADVTYDSSQTALTVTPHAFLAPGLIATDMAMRSVTLSDGRPAYVVGRLSAASVYSFDVVAFDFTDRFRWRSAAHNGATFLTSGLLSYLSTDRVQEASFLHTPQYLDATNTGTGVGPDVGVHSYVAVFKSVDGAGNLSVSGVSDPLLLTANASKVALTIHPLMITSRDYQHTFTEYYRTTAGGKVYYRVAVGNAMGGSGILTVYDTLDDAALISQPLLYGTGSLPGTGGAPLQREAPPYCSDVVSFNGMLVVASGSDLWWSGQTIGGEGAWFSASDFFVTVEGEGNITALAVADGTLYVFKERAIWAVAGEAPADNGTSGGLGTPRRLAGDVGCTEMSSVVVTSLGIFFRSHRGIEVLSRGGSPSWIGEQVQRTLATYPYITSATIDTRNTIVRFSLASSVVDGVVSGEGRDLIYDLSISTWQSVDDKYGSAAHQASQDACVVTYNGASRYAWLSSSGTIYAESDSYTDNNQWITMAAETGWFKVSGIQGRQVLNRLLLLARKRSAADLSISIGYNYDTEYAASQAWTSAQIAALLSSGWPITQLRHDPSDDGEGQSVRVRVEDAFPADEGEDLGGRGLTWLALTLDITPKDGPFEMPEGAS